jgi:hypothetical protein
VVRLTVAQERPGVYAWEIRDARGSLAVQAWGPAINAVLLPGRYQVRAAGEGAHFTGEFSVSAGHSFEYVVGD